MLRLNKFLAFCVNLPKLNINEIYTRITHKKSLQTDKTYPESGINQWLILSV